MSQTRAELRRFLVVGVCTVAIDLTVYRILLWLGVVIPLAKALGFLAGTLFAYFANKTFTFERAPGGAGRFALFYVLYGTTLGVNVGLNQLVIAFAGVSEPALALAFLVATGCSATLNFVGMKSFVFRRTHTQSEAAS